MAPRAAANRGQELCRPCCQQPQEWVPTPRKSNVAGISNFCNLFRRSCVLWLVMASRTPPLTIWQLAAVAVDARTVGCVQCSWCAGAGGDVEGGAEELFGVEVAVVGGPLGVWAAPTC